MIYSLRFEAKVFKADFLATQKQGAGRTLRVIGFRQITTCIIEMDTTTDLEHVDSPKNQVIYVFLEYLQDLKNEGKMTEDTLESVEVAMQCLNSSFGVDLNDEDSRKKYSIKPHSLPTVLGLGLSGKEKLAQALEKMVTDD